MARPLTGGQRVVRLSCQLWHEQLWQISDAPTAFTEFWYLAYHALFGLDLYLSAPWRVCAARPLYPDPLGDLWWIQMRVEEAAPDEMVRRAGEQKFVDAIRYVMARAYDCPRCGSEALSVSVP